MEWYLIFSFELFDKGGFDLLHKRAWSAYCVPSWKNAMKSSWQPRKKIILALGLTN